MSLTQQLQLILVIPILLLIGCVHPITEEARQQVAPQTTLAMVSKEPSAFLNQHLLVGGAVMALEQIEEGSVLEVMEWRLNRWGEPLYLDDAGRRFLVKTSEALNPALYEPGVLVTISGVVLGTEVGLSGEQEQSYPLLDMVEIHPWDIPFRYGIHNNPDLTYPDFVDQNDDPHSHPYDPGYNPFPYTQFWYRHSGN